VELDYHRGAQGFAIVELDTQPRSTPSWFPATWKRVVAEVDPPWGVRGFAWAPDSAHLAVLEASRDPKYELVDLLRSMLHPYGHHLFALEVYARSGQRVARSSLTREGEGVPFSTGAVVWFDGCGAAS
jgi:hypothetical protein